MSFIGVDQAGVQAWKARLDAKHAQVISALQDYKSTAQANNEVAKGAHFAKINSQCEDITGKHVQDHHQLHADYTTASNKLVQGVVEVAGA
jgi:hypothetical protein